MYMYNQEYMMGIMYMLCYLFFRVPLKDRLMHLTGNHLIQELVLITGIHLHTL